MCLVSSFFSSASEVGVRGLEQSIGTSISAASLAARLVRDRVREAAVCLTSVGGGGSSVCSGIKIMARYQCRIQKKQ